MNEFIPIMQVRTNEVLFYDQYTGIRKCNSTSYNPFSPPKTAYSGQMTHGAEKRMRKAVSLLLQVSPSKVIYNEVIKAYHPFRINFITLTCSSKAIVTHQELYKKCLRQYLDWQRRKGSEHYIWKVELQKRGQPHYHITTNVFIHYQEIRAKWNKLQRKAGYLDDYAAKHHHFNANSTDVHSVKNVQNIEAYLVKYLGKDPLNGNNIKIKGKIWDCSNSLKKPYFSTIATGDNIELARTKAHQYIVLENCAVARNLRAVDVMDKVQVVECQSYLNSL